ncbi:Ig-like domain-containing protein, partial [Tenacibaculum finnmarkense]|uniref:Ig-like domain-containing protein n=1 Tax=Tenacibaculum finnmarkense TaxID=2781243 RepID=UPI003BB504DB
AVVIGTNPGQVTLTGTIVPNEVTLNSDGTITVNAGAPSGTYEVTYEICENGANPENCKSNTATVLVENLLLADNDTLGTALVPLASGVNPVAAGSVLTGDTLNGVQVTTVNTDITPVTSGNILIDADGNVTIAANTPTGFYPVIYTICENVANPANCTEATVTVEVVGELVAVADTFTSINGKDGATTTSVLENDTLNGVKVVPSEVTLTAGTAPTPIAGSITMNADGNIIVAPGTTAGTYDYEYTICEKLNPANCSKVTSVVKVGKAPIEAIADNFAAINGKDGGKTSSLLGDDTLNGQPVVIGDVNLSVAGPLPTGLTLDTLTGEIIVAAGTAAGDYNVEYTICEKLNPANCSKVTSVVKVGKAPIEAIADNFAAINGKDGGKTSSLLGDDTLNGQPVVIGDVNLSVAGPLPTGLTLDTLTGEIIVAAGTAAGDYNVEYTICEKLNPANCSKVTSVVVVIRAPIAQDDSSTGNTPGDDVTVNLLDNDKLSDGSSITDPATQVTIDLDPSTPGIQNMIVVPNQGTWTVDPATGILTFSPEDGFTQTPTDVVYTLTEISTGLTDTATVKVEYTEVDIAVTEIDTPVVVDIFENDVDIPTEGTMTTTTPTNGTVEITDPNNTPNDPSDDVVTYVPNTDFTGTDTFDYTV